MSHEKVTTGKQEHDHQSVEKKGAVLESNAITKQNERLEQRSPDRNKHDEGERASREALEQARSYEDEKDYRDLASEHKKHGLRMPGKKQSDSAYDNIMNEVRGHLSPSSKAFSKFIHAPAVESASEAIGSTVARPNAILAGGLSAFAFSLIVYVVARHYGYALSGTESIAAFAVGWIFGIVFDYLRILITGKKH